MSCEYSGNLNMSGSKDNQTNASLPLVEVGNDPWLYVRVVLSSFSKLKFDKKLLSKNLVCIIILKEEKTLNYYQSANLKITSAINSATM